MSSRLASLLMEPRSSSIVPTEIRHRLVDDADAVAHALGNFQDVRGEEDGGAAFGHLAQDILDQPGGLGVQPDGRLIQYQHFRIVDQGGSQSSFLLHAMAVKSM